MNKIVNRTGELIEMVSKAYRFLLISLMLAKMGRKVDVVETKLEQLFKNIKVVDLYKDIIKRKIDDLNRELEALLK